MSGIDQDAINNLPEKDKAELRSFLAAANQRASLASTIHTLTDKCWTKCAGPTTDKNLTSTEKTCLANCADRFIDFAFLSSTNFGKMRQ